MAHDVDFPTQVGNWYPRLKGATDRTLSAATGYTEKQIGRWRATRKWPPPRNVQRIRANVEEWLATNRAKEPGKIAQSDTELARRGTPTHQDRDTSLLDTSQEETPPRTPRTIEEARAMGGADRSIVWAMLAKVADDDTEAWDDIREAIKAHWPERKARRGLHQHKRKRHPG